MTVNKQFSLMRNLANDASMPSQKTCRDCGLPATKEVLFAVGDDLRVVERYCDPCAQVAIQKNSRANEGGRA